MGPELALSKRQMEAAVRKKKAETAQVLPVMRTADGAAVDVKLALSLSLTRLFVHAATVDGVKSGVPAAFRGRDGTALVWVKNSEDGARDSITGSGGTTTWVASFVPRSLRLRQLTQSTKPMVVLARYRGDEGYESLARNWGGPGGICPQLQRIIDGEPVPVWLPWAGWVEVRLRIVMGMDMKAHWEILHSGGQRKVRAFL